MSRFLFYKKFFIAGILILAAVSALFFRDKVSRFFSFGLDNSPKVEDLVLPGSKDENLQGDGSSEVSPPKERFTNLPSYSGRDPQEVRPAPEEVKLFSEEQKESLYGQIRMHGKAVKDNPDYLFGWIQLGVLKKNIGDFEGARDAWEYAGIIRPENSVSFANLGELYWRYFPDFSKSEKNFRTSIKNKPKDSSGYISLSELYSYSYKEKSDFADDVLLEGIDRNPENIDLLKSLASLYQRMGDYGMAIEWWKKVLALEPGNSDVAALIKSLEEKIKSR